MGHGGGEGCVVGFKQGGDGFPASGEQSVSRGLKQRQLITCGSGDRRLGNCNRGPGGRGRLAG
jgi:hypothetical protein